MHPDLEDDLKALSDQPPCARLAGLEVVVWRRIAELRRARRDATTVYALRAAAVAGALGLGMLGGGATAVAVAAEMQEVSVFSVKTSLAPSTLLDEHG